MCLNRLDKIEQHWGCRGHNSSSVIASEVKQSSLPTRRKLDCFVASLLAMTAERPLVPRCVIAGPVPASMSFFQRTKEVDARDGPYPTSADTRGSQEHVCQWPISRHSINSSQLESYSGNPAFRSPSVTSCAFDCPPQAIHPDIVTAGLTSSRRAAASRASASRPRWAKADARQR